MLCSRMGCQNVRVCVRVRLCVLLTHCQALTGLLVALRERREIPGANLSQDLRHNNKNIANYFDNRLITSTIFQAKVPRHFGGFGLLVGHKSQSRIVMSVFTIFYDIL